MLFLSMHHPLNLIPSFPCVTQFQTHLIHQYPFQYLQITHHMKCFLNNNEIFDHKTNSTLISTKLLSWMAYFALQTQNTIQGVDDAT